MAGTQNAGSIVYEVDMDLDGFLRGQRRVSDSLNGMNRGFDASTRSINSTERSVNNAERSFSSLTKVAIALTAALSVQQVAQYADAWVTVNNKLANAIRPSEELADVTERVFDISQKTRSSLEATATLYARLERATRSAGTSTADLVTLTETINKGLAVSGATAEEASSTMIQLSQALASGVLRGEEFNSISENGSRLAVALSDSLGVTVGQLRAMAAQGKLTTDVVVKGLLSQGNAIAKEFSNTAMTMGQSFAVATNNVTKFVGESSTIKSAYNGFNNTVVTLSDNLDTLATVFVGLAAIMGSRFAGALAIATAAKVKNTVASVASAKAAAEAAQSAELEAGAKLRVAQADKSVAVSALNVAQARLNSLKVTNAASVEEVKLASAEAATIRTQIAQIESEKALETTRLKAQITDQGRIATATRMAQLQQASAALTARLATAEAAATQARSAAIVTAEAEVSAARIATANATGVATAANGRYVASQEAATVAARAASVGVGALRGALALVGGPAGVAMLAAAAIYYFWQKSEQAKKESIAFADSLDTVISKMNEMNQIQLRGTLADVADSIKNQKDNLADLGEGLDEAKAKAANFQRQLDALKGSEAPTYVIAEAQERLTEALREVDRQSAKVDAASQKLATTQQRQAEIQETLNRKAEESEAAFNILAEQLAVKIPNASKASIAAMASTIQVIDALNKKAKTVGKDDSDPAPSAKAQQLIKNAERRLALSKLEGEAKAKLQAQYDAEDAGIASGDKLIGVLQEQYAETERNSAAKKANTKESKANATAQDSIAQKLARLKQQSELAAGSTQELSRDQAILRAEQSLGKSATAAQIQQAKDYAAAIWDTSAALKARNAIPELKENADYSAQKSQLEMLKGAKGTNGELLISQEQYNQQSEQLEQEHQANLAKIRADQAVTPQQAAAGTVDPVQQLANENAQKLALIQQFEANKTITEQQGLALRNAANMEYEQARTNAMWELFKNQSDGNQILAAGFESLAGNASNAFTGIITGSMSAQEAMQSLASNALNSLINGFVQMGVEWVKSAIVGSTTQIAATTATTAASVAGTATTTAASVSSAAATTAAWTPAAIVASIGSFGGAAAIGIGAVVAAMALSSSLAGKRKNGGPVSAGSMYQVGEGGMPEIYQSSNGSQYMIPGDNGKVISNKDMQSGGGQQSVNIIFNDYSSNQHSFDAQASQDGNTLTVQAFITDMDQGGPMRQSITRNTSATPRATE
ncbi:tape measure protein [Enterobacteriaceae bacterium H11S18]|uniref:tape measure protein n=1 Tax=Dryocola clanedunensis TaxID=2925396 RepID=UPI0022F0BE2E|nr:tape measure protein [Dryocola clanedunensis]MCT4709491.1 tape measure protein [Dryocola clanedunensis]